MKKTSSLQKISRYASEDQQFYQAYLSAFVASSICRRANCRKHATIHKWNARGQVFT